MKRNAPFYVLTVMATVALSGCTAASRFEWGNYDEELYAYSKAPERGPQFEAALIKAIADGNKTKRLAPGLQAELGYLYLKDGKRDQAIEQFKAEIRDFPEATQFLNKIISEGSR